MKYRFTRALAAMGTFAQRPFTVVDVGALGGFHERWAVFLPSCRLIGFEPQGAREEAGHRTVYPLALGRQRETRTLNVAKSPPLSSFLALDESWQRRSCVFNDLGTVVRQVEVATVDLDGFCAEQAPGPIDFLKIDTEGTELEILQGAEAVLSSSVLGVELEVFFHSTHHGRCLFADVDVFLRGLGFILFDLKPWRFAKTALPSLEAGRAAVSPFGQVVGGDALYLRDLPGPAAVPSWIGAVEVAKLICLMELWDQPDGAVELLEWAEARPGALAPELAGTALKDYLIPPVLGRTVSADFYRQMAGIFR